VPEAVIVRSAGLQYYRRPHRPDEVAINVFCHRPYLVLARKDRIWLTAFSTFKIHVNLAEF
jgi:hypothetical protein